jgi:phosphodiesterase/alkaline phosphatase D-like protein
MSVRKTMVAVLAALSLLGAMLASSSLALASESLETPATGTATGVTTSGATLHGELNPGTNVEEVEYQFYYVPSPNRCTEGAEVRLPSPPGKTVGSHQAVSLDVTGLLPHTTYAFCLVGFVAGGEETQGSSSFFTTAPVPPDVEGESTSAVTPFGAVLEATVNANNDETTYSFQYATNPALTGAKTVAGPSPLVGSGAQTASATIGGGLTPTTTYYYKVTATNGAGSAEGTVHSFTTLEAQAPVVEGESASAVTPFAAVLEGTVNANSEETTYSFEYATNEALTGATTVTGSSPLVGPGGQAVSIATGALTPSTTYYYKLKANDTTGPAEGAVQSFTTLAAEAPIVEGETSSGLTSNSVTVEGQVNPNYQETTYSLEYGTGEDPFDAPTTVPGTEPLVAGFGDQPVSFALSGLTPGTVYTYRITAVNGTNTTHGEAQTIETQDEPFVVTGGSSQVTRTTASLAGTVNPRGLSTLYHYVYGTTSSYGRSTSSFAAGAGFAEVAADASLEELEPGTTYHYTLVATNSEGTVTGSDHTFTTSAPTPPSASTGQVSGVGNRTATIEGTVEPNGLNTTYQFQLGTEAGVYSPQSYGSASGSGALVVSLELQALAPGVTYHYRVVATNQDGIAYGQDQTFTTPGYPNLLVVPVSAAPALAVAAPAVTSTSTVQPAVKPPAKKPVKKPKKKKKTKKKSKKKKKKK